MSDLDEYYPDPPPRSMDDLPDVDHTFAFRADLADALVPANGPAPYPIPDGGYTIRFARQHEPANDTFSLHPDLVQMIVDAIHESEQGWRWGVLVRPGSVWIGAHWSPTNRRLCVNFIPFVTLWVTAPGGVAP